jgi:hypothetical protein
LVAHTHQFILADDPEVIVEQVAGCVDMGFTNLVFHLPAADQIRALNAFAADVQPRMRDRFARSTTAEIQPVS